MSMNGVTLAEMMVVVAIVGIVASVGAGLMISITRFFQTNRARNEIQRDARDVFALVSRNLRQAKASTVTIDNATGQPPYSRISFTKVTGEVMACYQDGGSLKWVDGSTRTVSSNLRYLAFSHPKTDDDNIISISMSMEKATYQGGTKALQLAIEKVRIMND